MATSDIYRPRGSGTPEDPYSIWLFPPPKSKPGRDTGCEQVAREGAKLYGYTHIEIRQADHRTTREMVNGRKIIVKADWHITVYLGWDGQRVKEGEIFLVHDKNGVPSRMMLRSERTLPINGENPLLYDYREK